MNEIIFLEKACLFDSTAAIIIIGEVPVVTYKKWSRFVRSSIRLPSSITKGRFTNMKEPCPYILQSQSSTMLQLQDLDRIHLTKMPRAVSIWLVLVVIARQCPTASLCQRCCPNLVWQNIECAWRIPNPLYSSDFAWLFCFFVSNRSCWATFWLIKDLL